ncbi:unnamed protein product [Somion occarium]|uniref:Uncharacterized protein n=1 Tax=Somion occarium TaxID=3059160 RepID=A0ABP1CQX6_9APHY
MYLRIDAEVCVQDIVTNISFELTVRGPAHVQEYSRMVFSILRLPKVLWRSYLNILSIPCPKIVHLLRGLISKRHPRQPLQAAIWMSNNCQLDSGPPFLIPCQLP